MATDFQTPRLIRFGIFEMDLDEGELRKKGAKLKLQAQPFRVLEFLALRPGVTVLRQDLYCLLSSHSSYDSKHALNNAVQKIREALGDSAENPRFVETVAGRGYRFLPDVEFISGAQANVNVDTSSTENLFAREIAQIRQEFLATDSVPKLRELVHRIDRFIDRNRQHPSIHEAHVLLDEIEGAFEYSVRSEQNRLKHGISFETAAGVFADPRALSLWDRFTEQGGLWQTLGCVRQILRPLRRSVLLMVSHYGMVTENGKEVIRIRSVRKATEVEQRAYEQSQEKED